MYLPDRNQLLDLATNHGTPLYAYDQKKVSEQYRNLKDSITFDNTAIHYAIKANSHPDILRTLKLMGVNVECVSVSEIKHCIEQGFSADQIIFTGSGQSQSDIALVVDQNIQINADSLNQLEWIGQHKPGLKVSLRLNTDFGDGHHQHVVTGGNRSKFGIHMSDLDKVKIIINKYNLIINGLHQHIGSLILKSETFLQAMEKMYPIANQFDDLEFMDFGGSFGVPYRPDQQSLDVNKLGKLMSDSFEIYNKTRQSNLKMKFEPGRFIVAESGTLLATVTDIKVLPNRTFVLLNTGMNHLIRPALYDSYHHITNLSNPDEQIKIVTIGGNICESGDIFGFDRKISNPRIGDVLAIHTTGAYGFVMASNYNLHNLPKEVCYNV